MIYVAILTGGPSAERGVALRSAALVSKYLDPSKYCHRTIVMDKNGWFDQSDGSQVDLNSFSLNGVKFDFVFLMVHGTPVEDGKLQGYFESMGIPHSTCDTLTCALTFNKQWCKDVLSRYGVPMAESRVVEAAQWQAVDPDALRYPLFVKPNQNGSSYGVSKVNSAPDLPAALQLAGQYDTEIMVEEYIAGREFGCGVVRDGEELHVFPLTEIIPEGEYFDYEAKYEGASQEITPADLPDRLSDKCKALSARIYRLLNCRGIVRFDYILDDDTFKLLEVNTVPGMSEASIIPQQAIAYGWNIPKLLDVVVQNAMANETQQALRLQGH